MQKLILIAGNGGAGKKTSAQLLYENLPGASWTHMRWMTALKIWEPTAKYDTLLLRNAAAVIGNYLDAGVENAILSGGVVSQLQLDQLLKLLGRDLDVRYFWLKIPDDVRARRLIERERDSGDSPETVPYLIRNFTAPKPQLTFSVGRFCEVDTGTLAPNAVVARMLTEISREV